MNIHKIIQGTEKNPIIYGLDTRYLPIFLIICMGGAFIFSFLFVVIGIKNIFILIGFLIAMAFFYNYLRKKCRKEKHPKSTKIVLMSNKHLTDIL